MTRVMDRPAHFDLAGRLVLTLFLVAGALIISTPALACSCATLEPRDALSEADAALVGVVSDTPGGPIAGLFGGSTYRIQVEHDLKGNLDEEIDVDGGPANNSCGLGLRSGERVGLLLAAGGGHWRAILCSTIAPGSLLAAAEQYPAPEGVGPIRFLVGGGFGDVRVMALDERGRTLAYGAGAGNVYALDACPGEDRFVEGVGVNGNDVLVVRRSSSLEPLREVALDLGEYGDVYDVRCLDRRGHHLLAIGGIDRLTRVLDVVGTDVRVLLDERTSDAWIQGDQSFVVQDGWVVCVPARAEVCDRPEIRIPSASFGLRWSPDGTRLAGFRYGDNVQPEQPSEVFVIEASTGSRRTFDLAGSNFVGDVSWVDPDTLAYLPGGGDDGTGFVLRVHQMEPVARIHNWYTQRSTVINGQAYGVGWGQMMWVDLPSGNVHAVQVVGDTYALEVLAGDVEADPQPPPKPELRSEVTASQVAQVVGGSPLPWVVTGAVILGLIVMVVRRSRRRAA
ncbi:MAG TPA: hypothetical protein VNP90_05645 [Actinomycetota bacterium]|nr:hypothetical protein [Actinomycetota bacterium]